MTGNTLKLAALKRRADSLMFRSQGELRSGKDANSEKLEVARDSSLCAGSGSFIGEGDARDHEGGGRIRKLGLCMAPRENS